MSFPQKPVDGQLYKGYLWDDAQGLWVKNETDVIVLNHGDSYKLPLAAEVGDSLVFLLPLANIGVQNSTYIEHAAGAIITRGENKTVEEGAGRVLVRSGQTLELVRKHSIVSKTAPPVIPPEKKDADITTSKEAFKYSRRLSFSPNKKYLLSAISTHALSYLEVFKKKGLYYVNTGVAIDTNYSNDNALILNRILYDTISWSADSYNFAFVETKEVQEVSYGSYATTHIGNVYDIREAPDSGAGDPGVSVRRVWHTDIPQPVYNYSGYERMELAFSNKDRLLAVNADTSMRVLDFRDHDNPVELASSYESVVIEWDATENILITAPFRGNNTYPENSIVLTRTDYSDPSNITKEDTYENTLLDGASQSVIDALGENHEFKSFDIILTHPIISSLLLVFTYGTSSRMERTLQIYDGRVINVFSDFSTLQTASFSPNGRFLFEGGFLYSVGAGDVPFNQETEDRIDADSVTWKEDSSGFFVLNNGVVSFYLVQRVYENSWSLVHIEGLPVEDTDFQTITEEG